MRITRFSLIKHTDYFDTKNLLNLVEYPLIISNLCSIPVVVGPFKREIPNRLREYLEHFMRVIPCDQDIWTIQLDFLIFVEIMIILGAISEREIYKLFIAI